MTAYQGFRVAATTAGVASSPFEHLRVNYVYGGGKADAETVSAPLRDSSSARKRQRLGKLAELEKINPPLSLAEKARRMGLAPKTVRGYLKELAEQRTGVQQRGENRNG